MLKVRNIYISGNRHTKSYIIKRELDIYEGNLIPIKDLVLRISKGRQNIYNTTLFTEVKADPLIVDAYTVDILVEVREKWYIYPLPEFSLVDPSIEEWINKYHASLSRVNYGIRFVHHNLTGRRDELNLKLSTGYTTDISLRYTNPYANSALTKGYSFAGGYSKNKEVAFKTSYTNSYVYYDSPDFIRTAWNIEGAYYIRKHIKKSESIGLRIVYIAINDTLVSQAFNPHYFNTSTSQVTYPEFFYGLAYNDVNNILYPLKGYTATLGIIKRGLGFTGGINMLQLQGEYDKYWKLKRKWYASMQLQGKIKLPFDQPYYNQTAMGSGNTYLRGLDYSIIDGVLVGLAKFNLKRELFNFKVPTVLKKSKTFHYIPFHIYGKIYTDYGYCYTKEEFSSQLNNKFLYSGGLGIDILTIYDLQFRFEYSFNQLGQNGLFLHNDKGF